MANLRLYMDRINRMDETVGHGLPLRYLRIQKRVFVCVLLIRNYNILHRLRKCVFTEP